MANEGVAQTKDGVTRSQEIVDTSNNAIVLGAIKKEILRIESEQYSRAHDSGESATLSARSKELGEIVVRIENSDFRDNSVSEVVLGSYVNMPGNLDNNSSGYARHMMFVEGMKVADQRYDVEKPLTSSYEDPNLSKDREKILILILKSVDGAIDNEFNTSNGNEKTNVRERYVLDPRYPNTVVEVRSAVTSDEGRWVRKNVRVKLMIFDANKYHEIYQRVEDEKSASVSAVIERARDLDVALASAAKSEIRHELGLATEGAEPGQESASQDGYLDGSLAEEALAVSPATPSAVETTALGIEEVAVDEADAEASVASPVVIEASGMSRSQAVVINGSEEDNLLGDVESAPAEKPPQEVEAKQQSGSDFVDGGISAEQSPLNEAAVIVGKPEAVLVTKVKSEGPKIQTPEKIIQIERATYGDITNYVYGYREGTNRKLFAEKLAQMVKGLLLNDLAKRKIDPNEYRDLDAIARAIIAIGNMPAASIKSSREWITIPNGLKQALEYCGFVKI